MCSLEKKQNKNPGHTGLGEDQKESCKCSLPERQLQPLLPSSHMSCQQTGGGVQGTAGRDKDVQSLLESTGILGLP
jgi:hypothetical protein